MRSQSAPLFRPTAGPYRPVVNPGSLTRRRPRATAPHFVPPSPGTRHGPPAVPLTGPKPTGRSSGLPRHCRNPPCPAASSREGIAAPRRRGRLARPPCAPEEEKPRPGRPVSYPPPYRNGFARRGQFRGRARARTPRRPRRPPSGRAVRHYAGLGCFPESLGPAHSEAIAVATPTVAIRRPPATPPSSDPGAAKPLARASACAGSVRSGGGNHWRRRAHSVNSLRRARARVAKPRRPPTFNRSRSAHCLRPTPSSSTAGIVTRAAASIERTPERTTFAFCDGPGTTAPAASRVAASRTLA